MFTLQDDSEKLDKCCLEGVAFIRAQLESAPTTGKCHWQGYIQMNYPCGRKALFDALELYDPFWCEPAKGTPDECVAYCSKAETWTGLEFQAGILNKGAGQRNDLKEAAAIAIGGDMKNVDVTTYIRYHRGLEKLRALHITGTRPAPVVEWLWGPTGTGKSRAAAEENPNAYWKMEGIWWDGYDPNFHKTVIIDEWTPDFGLGASTLLRVLDRYPLQVPFKGGYVPFKAEKVVITSNYRPGAGLPAESQAPLARRIGLCREFAAQAEDQAAAADGEPAE